MTATRPGPLALVGGGEFGPGNEEQDRVLLEAAAGRPAYVVATAAARQAPEKAVATATRWFAGLGCEVRELRLRTRAEARAPETVALARNGGLFYLAGGDPGLVVQVLRGSEVWAAMAGAWRGGAALAGSSAGAMALCEWLLLRAGWPDRTQRRWADALGVVPGVAVVPHLDTFGERWLPSAGKGAPDGARLVGVDERTAALWVDGGWRSVGPGRVIVVDPASGHREEGAEATASLPDPATAPVSRG